MIRLHDRRPAAVTLVGSFCVAFALALPAAAAPVPVDSGSRHAGRASGNPRVSPAERIPRALRPPVTDHSPPRPLDGYGNNLDDPAMNADNTMLRRYLPSDYTDGYNEMAGLSRPGPRIISNQVFAQTTGRPNKVGATDFLWQWGQFLDHDIDLTGGIDPPQSQPVEVPVGDPQFDVYATGGKIIDFNRSVYAPDEDGIRQQVNEITGWIDASSVYGSDDERSAALRTPDDSGRLRTGTGDLLPDNVSGLPNAGGDGPDLFLAGDVRANEQVALTAMHTLFMREHNRWAGLLRRERPGASGDEIFAAARALVAGEIQHITYAEFLPVLLGRDALPPYLGYDPHTDARIMNEFSTAAFRLGHSMLSPTLLRLDASFRPIAAGNLPLREGFFAPDQIRRYGIEPLLRGLSQQACQDVDSFVVDDVRNFLFGAPGAGGFDLVSLNIQRGRDHGLPGYNAARRALGLRPAADFGDVSSDPEVVERLRRTYAGVEDVDLWVGGMAEDKYRDSMLGELFHLIVKRQFEALRDGDRLWYARSLSRADLERVKALSLADVIRLNTDIGPELQSNVFLLPGAATTRRARGTRR